MGSPNRRHGHAGDGRRGRSPEYHSWQSMKARCTRPTHPRFADYGGRGIRVCERWARSFEAFLDDLGPRPLGMTLDRIDVHGDYEPSNCRWADAKTQRANRRDAMAAGDFEAVYMGHEVEYEEEAEPWPDPRDEARELAEAIPF